MEFLAGEDLGDCLARIGHFGDRPTTAAAIGGQLASALALAHGKGIIHRDLKPDNIFLASTPDAENPINVKILDFGIAKLAYEGAEAKKTRTGSLLGTPLYMSPEQCKGAGRVDHRTDIYSLGCILFELLSGRPPFIREGAGELIIAHVSEPPPDLISILPSTPAELSALVKTMLAKEPDQRPSSMGDVVRHIEDFLKVRFSQFTSLIGVPEGFPAHRAADDAPDLPLDPGDADSSSPGIESSSSMGSQAAIPTPVQAGGTMLLPEKRTTFSQTAAEITSSPGTRSRNGLKVGIGAAVLAAGGIAALVIWTASPKTDRPPAAAESARPAPPLPPPAQPAPVVPSKPSQVTIDLESAPAGLSVEIDGSPGRLPVVLPYGTHMHVLTFRAPGYKPETAHVDGARDKTIVLNMQRADDGRAIEKARHHRPQPQQVAPPEQPQRPGPRRKTDGFTDL
jgi:serine/threonine-protein kinase